MDDVTFIQSLLQNCSARFDANDSAILARKLEFIKAKVYEKKYPALKARTLIPMANDVDPGASEIVFEVSDWFGEARIAANLDDKPPFADVSMTEVKAKVYDLIGAYRFSYKDLQRSRMSGFNIPVARANACRAMFERKLEKIGALGDSTVNMEGLLNQSGVGTLAPPSGGTWSTKTSAQIVADMNALTSIVITDTLEAHQPDTIVMAQSMYELIRSKPYGVDSTLTVLKFFLETNDRVKEVKPWHYANTAGVGSSTRMVAYPKDEDVLTFEVPEEFTQLPAEAKTYHYEVPCHATTAGVCVKFPKALRYMDGC